MSVNKMHKPFIFLKLLHFFSFILYFIALLWVRYKYLLDSSFRLPYRKAHVTPSPSLPRARNPDGIGMASSLDVSDLGQPELLLY